MTDRPPADQGPQSDALVRRLRDWSASSWAHRGRREIALTHLQQLADLTADAAGEPRRRVPDDGYHAIGDQLVVLIDDARRSGVAESVVSDQLGALASALRLP